MFAIIYQPVYYLIAVVVVAVLCLYMGYQIRRRLAESKVVNAEDISKKIIEDAQKEVENKRRETLLEAKDVLFKSKADFEKETEGRRKEIQELEKRFLTKEENLERRVNLLEKKEGEFSQRENQLQQSERAVLEKKEKYQAMLAEQQTALERVSGMTSEDAKKELLARMESKAQHEVAKTIRRIEDEARETADKKSKEIISTAIQRCAGEWVAESTVSVVELPNNEMKGRIIGREGRNIRALEMATGIDLIIDDTPEAVILSGFDPIRREVARNALERLIHDGRIHPARIEDVVAKSKKEVEAGIKEAGEQATLDSGVHGLHQEEIKLIGRLKYRTSYAQNVLIHSKEVAFLAGVMAAELGQDVQSAKRAGLLHDIGKAIDREVEGAHAEIGADLAKKYNEQPLIVNAIASHHEAEEAQSIIAVLIQAADALSAARPGARRESMESYVKRLEQLEEIAESFKGVDKTFAIQAGRELRIIVKENRISDDESAVLARDIAKKIEDNVKYPGQIKITVIREHRSIEYAK